MAGERCSPATVRGDVSSGMPHPGAGGATYRLCPGTENVSQAFTPPSRPVSNQR